MNNSGFEFKDFTISHAKGAELLSITAQVAPGEILSVMGPSGSGKSTLLSAIIGNLPKAFTHTGQILLDGLQLDKRAPQHRKTGILFQDHLLFPHMSVGQNIGFGLPKMAVGKADLIAEALKDIDLEGYEDRDPETLSGGQRARVALMRTLLAEPKALLLDEPFSRLDTDLREKIRDFVFTRARAAGLPVILVTHDVEDVQAAGGQVLDLGEREL